MDPVRAVSGTAVPLDRSDVDTDQIIPSDWLKRVERTGFGKGLFSEWRDDRDFVMNKEEHQGANILIAGKNFGTGSSREHAVWALTDHGFEAVVSSRFADIFRNNAGKNGLVTVHVTEEVVQQLMAAVQDEPSIDITIDVERRTISAPQAGIEATFTLDDSVQHRLLHGLDDIGITLAHEAEIDTFEAQRPSWLPSTT
jgi:3-isopropylmalate/(R)-2-methylmalate dehydratase small subunit